MNQPSCQPRHPPTRRTEPRLISAIIRSGLALFDDWLTGVREGSAHLLTGGPGTGKSTIALHFAATALERGQRVAMVVSARASDVKSHARYMGVDLDTPLRDGRLLLLRYRADLVHTATHAVSPSQAVAELDGLVTRHAPARIVIDGLAPIVSRPAPLAAVSSLAALLERGSATSLLTFSEDLSDGYDRGVEPIVQASAFVVRLATEADGVRRAELVNLRYPAPLMSATRFIIRPGVGVVGEHAVRAERVSLRIP